MCLESYLQGQSLWDVMGDSETTSPFAMDAVALCKWKVREGKFIFVMKTTKKEEMLKHVRKVMTLEEASNIIVTLFTKANDAQL